MAQAGVKRLGVRLLAGVQGCVDLLQPGRDGFPVIESRLQGGRNGSRTHIARQVAADDDQGAIAAAVFQGGEFHGIPCFSMTNYVGACIHAACLGARRVCDHSSSISHLTASSLAIISGVPTLAASSKRWPLGSKK